MWPFTKAENEEDLLRELAQGMASFLSAVSSSSAPPRVKEILMRDIPTNVEWINAYARSLRGGSKGTGAMTHAGITSQANDVIKKIQNGLWGWSVPGVKGNWFDSLPKPEQDQFRTLYAFVQDKVRKLIKISNELGKS